MKEKEAELKEAERELHSRYVDCDFFPKQTNKCRCEVGPTEGQCGKNSRLQRSSASKGGKQPKNFNVYKCTLER